MKIRITYPGLNGLVVDIEDTPDQCAQLLADLGLRADTNQPVTITEEPSTEGSPCQEPALPFATRNAGGADVKPKTSRTYGGRSNRRALILDTLRNLRQSGIEEPDLNQIKTRFRVLFPDEPIENLEQVVRDLANKTSLLERLGRGTFRLAIQD